MRATKVELVRADTMDGISMRLDAMAAAINKLNACVTRLVDAMAEDEEPDADPFQSLEDEPTAPVDRGSSLDG